VPLTKQDFFNTFFSPWDMFSSDEPRRKKPNQKVGLSRYTTTHSNSDDDSDGDSSDGGSDDATQGEPQLARSLAQPEERNTIGRWR
jgi:hypothetical protein